MMTLAALSLLVALVFFSMITSVIRATVWAVSRIRRGEPLLAKAPERGVPWGFGSVLLVILLWLAYNVGVGSIYAALTAGASMTHREYALAEVMLIVSLVNGGVLLTVPVVLKWTSGASLRDIGVDPHHLGGQLGTGVLAFLVIAPFVYAFNIVAALIWKATPHALENMVRADRSEDVAMLAVVSAVLLAPAAEELIFRGVLQSWLHEFFRRRWQNAQTAPLDHAPVVEGSGLPTASSPEVLPAEDPEFSRPPLNPSISRDYLVGPPWFRLERSEVLAIVIASALFAAVHLPQWPAPLALFVLSLGLGLVYRRTGSLVAVIVMHAMFNGLGTLLLYWALQLGDMQSKSAKPPAGCVVRGSNFEGSSQHPEAIGLQ